MWFFLSCSASAWVSFLVCSRDPPLFPLLSSKSKETFVWVGNTISGKQKYFQLSEEFAGRKVPINLHYSEISLIIKRWEDDKGGIGL